MLYYIEKFIKINEVLSHESKTNYYNSGKCQRGG